MQPVSQPRLTRTLSTHTETNELIDHADQMLEAAVQRAEADGSRVTRVNLVVTAGELVVRSSVARRPR
jgi:hypothetical protein